MATSVRTIFVIGPKRLELPCGEYLIGRSRECALRIDDPYVSRVQLRCRVLPDQVLVEDRGLKNKSLLNGRSMPGSSFLADGDELLIGSTVIKVEMHPLPSDQNFEDDTLTMEGDGFGPFPETPLTCPACNAELPGDVNACPSCGEVLHRTITRTQELPLFED